MVTLESCVPVPPPQPSHDNSSLVALFYPPLHNLNILLKEAMLSFDQSLLTPFFHVPMATRLLPSFAMPVTFNALNELSIKAFINFSCR